MHVSFEEIGRISATFTADTATVGGVCALVDNGKIGAATDGGSFIGVVESFRAGAAGVQLHGFAEVVYTGSAPALGFVTLAANGSGGVKTAASGRSCLVIAVDTAAKTAVIEL